MGAGLSFKNKEVLKVAMEYVKLDGGWFENFEFKGTFEDFFWPGQLPRWAQPDRYF